VEDTTMTKVSLFGVHRLWEDWLSIVAGVLIGLSPWLSGAMSSSAVMWNTTIVGALVIGLAALELVDLRRWEEGLEMVLGVWLVAAPFVFGYAGTALMYWHLALGVAVIILAFMELTQDWKASDGELAQHGH
jgi:hypothetical protein